MQKDNCAYNSDDSDQGVFFTVFLSSELQAAQMERSKMGSKKEGRDGNFHQDLQDICQTLVLPEPRGRDIEEVFSQVEEQVRLNVSKMLCFI
jgi:hypothetical protein